MDKRFLLSLRNICLISIILFFLQIYLVDAKMSPSTDVKLTLENQPEVGGIAILKLVVSDPTGLINTNIACFLSSELKLLSAKDYKIINEHPQADKGEYYILFYSGPMNAGEKKEFLFKVYIPNEEKYCISGWGGRNFDVIEIDLGDPEPPEWPPQAQQNTRIIAGRDYIITDIQQIKGQTASELTIPKEDLPPLRTELRIRTKDSPELGAEYSDNPKGPIPFRHLVYVENESPQVEVNCILPQGLEIAYGSEYKTSQDSEGNTRVLLYSGAMRFKESKAIYFQVKLAKPLNIGERETITKTIQVETKLLTQENETLTKTDSRSISFGRILY